MDKPQNRSFIEWQINIGDIVRYKEFAAAHIEAYHWRYGLVVGEIHTDQETLFPAVRVYLFEEKETRVFVAGQVECVSSAKI